jgi:hypothetical protein
MKSIEFLDRVVAKASADQGSVKQKARRRAGPFAFQPA